MCLEYWFNDEMKGYFVLWNYVNIFNFEIIVCMICEYFIKEKNIYVVIVILVDLDGIVVIYI